VALRSKGILRKLLVASANDPSSARCVLRPPLLLGGKTHFTGVPVGLPLCIIKSRPEAKSEAD